MYYTTIIVEDTKIRNKRNSLRKTRGKIVSRMFFCTGATTHCGFVFCSPLAGL